MIVEGEPGPFRGLAAPHVEKGQVTQMSETARLFWGDAAQAEIAKRMKVYTQLHPEADSFAAYRAVLDADPGLKLAYAGLIRTEQEAKTFLALRGLAEMVGRETVVKLARSL